MNNLYYVPLLLCSYSLTRHLISFFLPGNQICYIGLCDKFETVNLSITAEDEKEPVDFAERLELIKFVEVKLLELAKTFMKTTHPPKPYLICACECCGEVQFELDDVLNDEEILYCRKKKAG